MGNLRLVYLLHKETIYFLIAFRRKNVYDEYYKRLYDIKKKLEE